MDGREFLVVAGELVSSPTEAHWRTAAGRSYYSVMLEAWRALQRWGFIVPPRDNVHTFVRLRFSFAADHDLKAIGDALDRLSRLRNQADYQIGTAGPFGSVRRAEQAIIDSRDSLNRLTNIEGDPSRQAMAIAAIRTAWP